MLHFQCQCTACVNNYPLANELPATYSEMAKVLYQEKMSESYFHIIKDKMEKSTFDWKILTSNTSFKDILLTEIRKSHTPDKETIINIYKILDEYHAAINEELILLIKKKNIDSALQLYYERQKLASLFLKPPHMMFLIGAAAITECLWVKYGNKSYGTSRTDMFGGYM